MSRGRSALGAPTDLPLILWRISWAGQTPIDGLQSRRTPDLRQAQATEKLGAVQIIVCAGAQLPAQNGAQRTPSSQLVALQRKPPKNASAGELHTGRAGIGGELLEGVIRFGG